MPRAPSGEIRKDTIKEKQRNGSIYVYERETRYDPEKRRNVYVSKTLIGKIPAGHPDNEPPVPTREKRKRTATDDQSNLVATCQSTGMMDILLHVLKTSNIESEIDSALKDYSGMAQKLQTATLYVAATDGATWPGMYNWTYKYLNQLPYSSNPISEDMAHEMFEFLGNNPKVKKSIFLSRAKDLPEEELIAVDSSTYVLETSTGEIHFVRKSIHKDKTIAPVFKVVVLYAIKKRRSIAYSIIPGNIPDAAIIPNVLKKLEFLNLRDMELISDGGYCSEENIARMLECEQSFVTHIEADIKWVYDIIKTNRNTIVYGGEILRCDSLYSGFKKTIVHTFEYVDKETGDEHSITKQVNVLIYYSSTNAAKDDVYLRETYNMYQEDLYDGADVADEKIKMDNFIEKYMNVERDADNNVINITRKEENWQKALKCSGFLVLISDKEDNLNRGLEKYRAREGVEEDIKGMKMHTKAKTTRKHSEATIDGQYLVKFEGNSLLNSLQIKLKSIQHSLAIPNGDYPHDGTENMKKEKNLRHWIEKTSKHNILDWFDGIKTTTISTGENVYQWKTETIARDQLFLEKIGLIKKEPTPNN